MIGLVFLGAMYYLESGWEEVQFYRRETESMTIHGAQLIIAYFSTVLVLSLLQEPFLPGWGTTLAFGTLAAGVIVITRSFNGALRCFEKASSGERDSVLFKWSQVLSWVAFVIVFLAPPVILRATQPAASAVTSLYLADGSVAWIVLLALLIGYWNLVQYLLFPYEVREMERNLE
jgi:hypothetical protein